MSVMEQPFLKLTPLERAIDWSASDIKGRAGQREVQWLHDHPRTWLVALTLLMCDIERQIMHTRTTVNAAKPRTTAEQPSAEYLELKRQEAEQGRAKRDFLVRVKRRRKSVQSLFGFESAIRSEADLAGDLAHLLTLLAHDDLASAEAKTRRMLAYYTGKDEA